MPENNMPNNNNLVPFEKEDSRINRRGRPRKADLVAQLSKDLLDELVPYGRDGLQITRLEAILRGWLDSNNFTKQLGVLHYAYGKAPDQDLTEESNATIIVNWGKTITAETIYHRDDDDPRNFGNYDDDRPDPVIDIS
jgi:hypothetical protein